MKTKECSGQVRDQSWGHLPAPRPGEARTKGHAGKSILGNGEGKVFHPKDNLGDGILGIVQKKGPQSGLP